MNELQRSGMKELYESSICGVTFYSHPRAMTRMLSRSYRALVKPYGREQRISMLSCSYTKKPQALHPCAPFSLPPLQLRVAEKQESRSPIKARKSPKNGIIQAMRVRSARYVVRMTVLRAQLRAPQRPSDRWYIFDCSTECRGSACRDIVSISLKL
jgi:hypothetical protein